MATTSHTATTPLQHVYPQWETPGDDPYGDERQVWRGEMRIVHAKRARKLRRRGVPLMNLRPRMREG